MNSIMQKTNTTTGRRFSSKVSTKSRIVVYSTQKKNASFNDFIEKRKEVDRLRIERIKEIGNTIDHVAKSEVKQTVEIMSEVMPFIKKIKGVEKIIGTEEVSTVEKPTEE
jgi:hypothetical protein